MQNVQLLLGYLNFKAWTLELYSNCKKLKKRSKHFLNNQNSNAGFSLSSHDGISEMIAIPAKIRA